MSDVVAPIVASVWKVLVAAGEQVEAGQTVAVLESMKMEIPVEATVAGVVAEICVDLGQIVQEGDAILRVG